jgi:uncharacterized protein
MPQTVRCPTCRQPTPWTGNPHRPFCSERCKLRDLDNWASERYRIPDRDPSVADETPGGDDDEGEDV